MPSLNVVNYIGQAIESVLQQTLTGIEVLCVDAGSDDGTLEIIREYVSADSRVKLILSDKKSYGYQMNLGIRAAIGEYIGIVETDDYVLPNMYETLYNVATKYNLDFVKSDYKKFWWDEEYSSYIKSAPSPEHYNAVIGDDERERFFEYSSLNWTGIYRRDYLIKNDIWHNETPGASYQDIGFWLLNMSYAKRAMWINEAFYMYRQSNPGASMKNRGKMLCSMEEYDRVLGILRDRGSLQAYYECLILKQMDYHVTFNRIEDSIKKQYLNELAKVYATEREEIRGYELKPYQGSYFTWVGEAVTNRDELCDSIIRENSRVKNIIVGRKNIYLYGAGQVASSIFMQLYALGYWEDVKKTVVTSFAGDKNFYKKDIVEYEDIKDRINKDDLIILGLGKKNRDEVINMLHGDGFYNVLVPEEIEGLIYII